MSIRSEIIELGELLPHNVTLVAVSKTYPPERIMEAYDAGQRIFGENRPQEMKAKFALLPGDIRWHMIGHLQTNKVKYIAPFVEMIHSADSARLLEVIDKEAAKNGRTIDVLLEIFIAQEESKSGWAEDELIAYLDAGEHLKLQHVRFRGVMGIASLTDDTEQIRREFLGLNDLYGRLKEKYFPKDGANAQFDTLSMGMSSDWRIALECGSNMLRIGSLIFGARDYSK